MDDWKKHDGGGCPVPRHMHVEVTLRNGDVVKAQACAFYWGNCGEEDDIVEYRVCQPPKPVSMACENAVLIDGYMLAMALLQSGVPFHHLDDETQNAIRRFTTREIIRLAVERR